MKNKKGFTLVELMVVIVIIGILAAVIIPSVTGSIEKANAKAAISDAKNNYSSLLDKLNLEGDDVAPKHFIFQNEGYTVLLINGSADEKNIQKGKVAITTITTPPTPPITIGGAKYTPETNDIFCTYNTTTKTIEYTKCAVTVNNTTTTYNWTVFAPVAPVTPAP